MRLPLTRQPTMSEPRSKYESFSSAGVPVPPMGLGMRDHFPLNFGGEVTFCNNGTHGASPKRVLQYRQDLQAEMDADPDSWFRLKLRPAHGAALAKVAGLLGSDPDNLAFVASTTAGVNTVVKNLRMGPNDLVLQDSHVYPSTANAVDSLVSGLGASVLTLDLHLPIESEEEVVDLYEQICKRTPSVRVAVLSHIAKCSSILFPVAKIARAISNLGITVVVDGAHAPMQVDLNLEKLGRSGISYYVGSLYKWGLVPRGCAVLWARGDVREGLRPLVTGSVYKEGFQNDFYAQGKMDHVNRLAASAAVDFFREVGGFDAILGHVTPLLDWAQDMVASSLGTNRLRVPKSMEAPYMRMVALPPVPHLKVGYETAELLSTQILEQFKVASQFTTFSDRMWVRLSCGMYNVREDYLKLRDAIVKLLQL